MYHRRTRLWLFVLAAVGEHFFLSSCLLATRSQNKQWPTIIFAWSYSTYYNSSGCRWAILSERASESRSNAFSRRHTPAWYTKMAAVTWPGDTNLRQLAACFWVLLIYLLGVHIGWIQSDDIRKACTIQNLFDKVCLWELVARLHLSLVVRRCGSLANIWLLSWVDIKVI